MDIRDKRADIGSCFICGKVCLPGHATCSRECHEAFVHKLEMDFGKYKKVIDTSGIHRVPTRDIIEKGLKQWELVNYPLWTEKDENHMKWNDWP